MLRIHTITTLMLSGLLAVCLFLAMPAVAADAAAETAAPAGEPSPDLSPDSNIVDDSAVYRLPAVTVTADKRVTEVQKTPMALTVMTEQDLSDKNIRTVKDVLEQVPNLITSNWIGGMNWTSFRGATTISATNTSPLIMYVDGVPVDTFYNMDSMLLDVERVEILRGPQSAIYGKNALGGVINIISKRPTNEFKGKIFSHVETFDGWGGGATISGPLMEDKLFFSLAAVHDYKGGWMKNDNTNKSNYEREERFKGQLLFTPSEDVEFRLHMDYIATRDGFTPYSLGQSYSNKSVAHQHDNQETDILSLAFLAKLRFDQATLESISTFRKERYDYRMSSEPWMTPWGFAGTGMAGRDNYSTEVTQELRLRSNDGEEGLNWLVGAFGSYADKDMHNMFQDYEYYLFPGLAENSRYDQPYREYVTEFAPFAQVVVPVTDAFKVTAGLRWHYTHRDASFNYRPDDGLQAAGEFLSLITGTDMRMTPMSMTASKSWNELLPKLNLSYQITDDHMVYAGVSRSFVPGGFNYATTKDSGYTYDSQTAWNYEVGAKTAWFDQRLNVNAALFYSTFDDLQVMQYDAAFGGYLANNAGKATSYGAELDVLARLAKGLDAQVSLGYTHARYDDYTSAQGDEKFDDNKIEFVPEYTLNASLKYRHDNGLFAMGQVHYLSKIYWEAKNTDYRNPVTTVDARVGYEGDSFDVYLYGKNIFGERYQTYYTSISNIGMMAPPQQFGIEMAYKF